MEGVLSVNEHSPNMHACYGLNIRKDTLFKGIFFILSQRFELMDGRRQPAPGAILSVSRSKDLEGHADVSLSVADKDVTFQVPAER